MSFGVLFLIVASGLLGPLFAGWKRLAVPLVVGEILAGIIFGNTGLHMINPADPTLQFLSAVGFALLMFLVGTHLPLRDPNLRSALKTGFLATGLAFAFAVPAGYLIGYLSGLPAPIFVLLLANSSAAVLMPIVHEQKLEGKTVLLTTTWVALADAVTIVALPLAMSPGKTLTIALGGALVLVVAIVSFFALSRARNTAIMQHYRKMSKDRVWALDLRISLALLLGLCWLATSFGTSDLVAGFAAGAVVSLVGGPKRLTKQLIGLGEGFFVPLFFVVLGAKLNFGTLFQSASYLELTALIAVATIGVHLLVARMVKLPMYSGLAASAQLGLPAAIVSLGLNSGVINSGQGSAIIAAALLSLISTTIGTKLLAKNAALEIANAHSAGDAPCIKPFCEEHDPSDEA